MPKYVWIILVAVMLAGTIGAFSMHQRKQTADVERFAAALQSLQRLEREVRVRAAMRGAELNGRGWPTTISPDWFGNDPPLNPLVEVDRPWVEIASESEAALLDPAIRQSVSRAVAAYWYNPASGIVRARVGVEATDELALETYNRLNGRGLETLFAGGEAVIDGHPPLMPPPRTDTQTSASEKE